MTSTSVISSVIARMGHLLESLDNSKDPSSWKGDAKKLLSGLESVNAELKNADQGTKQSAPFVKFKKQMVQLSYDIDDSIAAIELSPIPPSKPTKRLIASGKALLTRILPDKSSKAILEALGNELSSIKDEYAKTPQNGDNGKLEKRSTLPKPGKFLPDDLGSTEGGADDTVSLEEKVRKTLLSNQELRVVCVWGESGMGKTTLARKAFDNESVRRHFERFAWVSINEDFQTKQVLQEILLQLLPDRRGYIRGMDEFELTQQIFSVHKEKRCLVVLEDLCTVEDWESIRVAFPTTGQSSSKILITTPLEEVVGAATSGDGVCQMNPLTRRECFDLLKKAEIGYLELEKYGDTIFTLSGGSRLLALVLGKSLKTKNANAKKKLLDDLDKIRGNEQEILRLGYEELSHELKSCLVYMGQFPHGRDIEDEKLYLLLSTEGLIIPPEVSASASASTGRKTFMDILEKLAQRSFVQLQAVKVPAKRMYRSCKLHNQIREFCKSEGLEEEFFEIVDFKNPGQKLQATTRRFAIYLDKYRDENHIHFSNDRDMEKKIRSLLIFDTYESEHKSTTWPSEINDLKEFIRLRVLDFNGIDFGVRKLPKGIDKLVLLKYLSFRGCFLEDLPAYTSKLLCLETLDLRTNNRITIPDVLHLLKRLKHLYFPKEYRSHDAKNKLQLNGLEKLEILVNFDTSVCKVEHLYGLKNLQTLTVTSYENHEDLEVIIKCLDGNKANLKESSVKVRNFDCYTKERATTFSNLLRCSLLHSLNIEGHIGHLPKAAGGIYQSLTEMILDGSNLKDDSMEVLGKIKNLRILVLSNDAYVGKEMRFSAAPGFSNLTIFKLLNLSYLQEVTFEEGAMPKLSDLVIENCRGLVNVEIPEAMRNRVQDFN